MPYKFNLSQMEYDPCIKYWSYRKYDKEVVIEDVRGSFEVSMYRIDETGYILSAPVHKEASIQDAIKKANLLFSKSRLIYSKPRVRFSRV